MSCTTRSRGLKRTTKQSNPILFEYEPPGEAKEVITFSQHDNTQLQSPNYLNDTIISFFMQYHLDNFVDKDLKKRMHVFSSFFLSKIKSLYAKQNNGKDTTGTNHNSNNCASRWLKGVKIFEKDFLFLPVCEDDHWLLVIVCYPKKFPSINPEIIDDEHLMQPGVFILNSMKAPAPGVKKVLQKFLSNQWAIEKNGSKRSFAIHNAKTNGIRLIYPEVPQQRNNYNCGVYLLNYFKCFLKSPRESYIKMYRQRSLLDWFEVNDIRIQSERSRMIDVVRRQNKLWDTPENRAKRVAEEEKLQEHAIIEIN